MTIKIFYSCFNCAVDDIPIEVPARGKDQSLINWLDNVSMLCADDHSERSPKCHITEFSQIKIPHYTERVGAAQVN